MHDLTGGDLPDVGVAADLVDVDLVIAEGARTALLADLRRDGGIVHVLDLQDLTSVVVIRQE